MKKAALCAFALLSPLAAMAAEHPKEHPTTGGSSQEHPAQSSEPAKKTVDIQKEYEGIVKAYVAAEVKASKSFMVKDEVTGKDRMLSLVRVHRDRIVKLSDTMAFACSDFRTVRGGKDKLDLDFYVTKQEDAWKVTKVLIHKVNGSPRYTYNEKNEMVPAPEKPKP